MRDAHLTASFFLFSNAFNEQFVASESNGILMPLVTQFPKVYAKIKTKSIKRESSEKSKQVLNDIIIIVKQTHTETYRYYIYVPGDHK